MAGELVEAIVVCHIGEHVLHRNAMQCKALFDVLLRTNKHIRASPPALVGIRKDFTCAAAKLLKFDLALNFVSRWE